MNKDTRILIVEDEPLIAEDISGFLHAEGFTHITVVYDGESALKELEKDNADILLLDVNLSSSMSGIDLAKKVNADYHLPFIYITSYADTQTIREVKTTHPVGYILKPFKGKEIAAILEIGYELFYTFIGKPGDLDMNRLKKITSQEMTQRETDVLTKVAEGKTNQAIADELFLSLHTVKSHLKNIFIKLDVASRAEAIVLLNKIKITP
jgi:DNA-binding NarL/FixJ family response regulator